MKVIHASVLIIILFNLLNPIPAYAKPGFFNRSQIDQIKNQKWSNVNDFCYRTNDFDYYEPLEWYRFRYEYEDIVRRMRSKDGCYIFWIGKRFRVFITAYWWEDQLYLRYSTDDEVDAYVDIMHTESDYDYTKIRSSF